MLPCICSGSALRYEIEKVVSPSVKIRKPMNVIERSIVNGQALVMMAEKGADGLALWVAVRRTRRHFLFSPKKKEASFSSLSQPPLANGKVASDRSLLPTPIAYQCVGLLLTI